MKKRAISLLLSVVMLLSLCGMGLSAAAAEEDVPATETTAEPEATAEPEDTAEAEATAEPEATAETEATAEPEVTAEPEATEKPETTVEPEATEEPAPQTAEAPEGDEGIMPVAAYKVEVRGETGKVFNLAQVQGQSVTAGKAFLLEVDGDYEPVIVSGGAVGVPEYDCDGLTGVVTGTYSVKADGTGDLVIKIKAAAKPVKSIPVRYTGAAEMLSEYNKYEYGENPKYAVPGGYVMVYMNPEADDWFDYSWKAVSGGEYWNGDNMRVYSDATEVVIDIYKIEETAEPTVKLDIRDDSGKAVVKQDGKTLSTGAEVKLWSELTIEVPDGYVVGGEVDEYESSWGVCDYNGDGRMVILIQRGETVEKQVTLYFTGATTAIISGNFDDENNGETIFTSTEIRLQLDPKYELTVTNASVEEDHYIVDGETGEVERHYLLVPDGRGDVTVDVRLSGQQPPKPIEITYTGDKEGVSYGDSYCFPGDGVYVDVEDGYIVMSVTGGELSADYVSGVFFIEVDKNAKAVTVSVQKYQKSVLRVKGGVNADALVSGMGGRVFLTDGDEITGGFDDLGVGEIGSGFGQIMVKNGYTVRAVSGGLVDGREYDYTRHGGEIYRLYNVAATGSEVVVEIVPDTPARWVKATVNNSTGAVDTVFYGAISRAGMYETVIDGTVLVGSDRMLYLAHSPNYNYDGDMTVTVSGGKVVDEYLSNIVMDAGLMGEWVHYDIQVNDDADEVVINVTKGILGDVTGSGAVDDDDTLALFRYVMGKSDEPISPAMGDVTGDGVVDLKDVTRLYQLCKEQ